MNGRFHQSGMTFLGALVTLALGVFFMTLLFKIVPIYTEHSTVRTAMEAVKGQPELLSNSREMIIDMVTKRLDINNVTLPPQSIIVVKRAAYVKVQVKYDKVVPLYKNFDLVAHFDEEFETGAESAN